MVFVDAADGLVTVVADGSVGEVPVIVVVVVVNELVMVDSPGDVGFVDDTVVVTGLVVVGVCAANSVVRADVDVDGCVVVAFGVDALGESPVDVVVEKLVEIVVSVDVVKDLAVVFSPWDVGVAKDTVDVSL